MATRQVPFFDPQAQRQQAMAEQLMQQPSVAQNFGGGRITPSYGIGHGMIDAGNKLAGALMSRRAGKREDAATEERRQALSEALGVPQDAEISLEDPMGGPADTRTVERMRTPEQQRMAALVQGLDPQQMQAAQNAMLGQQVAPQQQVLSSGAQLVGPGGEVIADNPAPATGGNSRYASPQITESGRVVMMDKAGGPAIYADSGEPWESQSDPVSADMQLITLPDGSVRTVNMRRDVGRAATRAEEVVDPETAITGAAARSGAETGASEAAQTAAIPERTRVQSQAEDFAAAPDRLEASRAIVSGVEELDPVFEDVLENANLWTTGFLGQAGQYVGGTPQANLAANLNTLQANAAFDRLQAMREASSTGGALGQVSEIELQLLRDAMAALAQSQSPEQFKTNVQRLRDRYQSAADLAQQGSRIDSIKARIGALQNRPQSAAVQSQINTLNERLFREEDKLWGRLDEGEPEQDGMPDFSQMSDEQLREMTRER